MPSTVVISRPTASAASIRQEHTGSPSSITVHAPQPPRSQTSFAPVSSRWLRRARSSVTRGSTVTVLAAPLILSVSGTASGPSTCGADSATPLASVLAAAPTPALLRKERRVKRGPLGLSEGGLAIGRTSRGGGLSPPAVGIYGRHCVPARRTASRAICR